MKRALESFVSLDLCHLTIRRPFLSDIPIDFFTVFATANFNACFAVFFFVANSTIGKEIKFVVELCQLSFPSNLFNNNLPFFDK